MSATEAASMTASGSKSASIFDNLFAHCHMDNSVYVHGMFWIGVFIVTYIGTLYYKYTEAQEAKEAEQKKRSELAAKARERQTPLIQPLARPIEKKIEVPGVEVVKKAKKVSKSEK